MENEKCEQIMNEYLMLDKGERVPFALSLHLLTCRKCRKQIKMLELAEKKIAEPLNIVTPVTDESIQKVLEQIKPEERSRFVRPLPFASWIIGGVIMIALLFSSMATTPFFHSRTLSLWYALTIAGCVTAYSSVFVFSNIDVFIKKISTVAKNLA